MESSPPPEAQTDLPKQLEQYLSQHGILVQLNNLVNELLRNQPDDPFAYMIEFLSQFAQKPPQPLNGAGAKSVGVVDSARTAELEAELERLRQSYDQLQQSQLQVSQASTASDAQLRQLVGALGAGGAADAMERAHSLSGKVASLQGQLDELHRSDSAGKQSKIQLESALESLRAEKQKLEDDARRKQSQIGDLGAKLAPLRKQCKEMRRQLAKTKTDVAADISDVSGPFLRQVLMPIKEQLRSADSEVQRCMALYRKEMETRKALYNQIQELRGNIRVYCRVRPMGAGELGAGSVTFPEEDTISIVMPSGNSRKSFEFDRVYSPDTSQETVFSDTKPLVTSVVDGYNVCIFAYGQTGSGKTYTMEGPESNRGVNFRALKELFEVCESRKEQWSYEIVMSMVEIYNETVRDLLADPRPVNEARGPGRIEAPKYEIRQGPDGNYVPDLVSFAVETPAMMYDIIKMGGSNRATFATNMNEHSSRSHCVLMVKVTCRNKNNNLRTLGKINLVDLAGSERIGKSEASGDRLKEAQAINKSLSALGDVIHSLATSNPHVPYRNSKLTYLLQDSLGGHSKVLMFLQISPTEDSRGESMCSLTFGARVRGVELGQAKKKVDRSQDDLDSADARPAQQPGSARRVSMTPQKLGIPSGVQRSKSRSSINSELS